MKLMLGQKRVGGRKSKMSSSLSCLLSSPGSFCLLTSKFSPAPLAVGWGAHCVPSPPIQCFPPPHISSRSCLITAGIRKQGFFSLRLLLCLALCKPLVKLLPLLLARMPWGKCSPSHRRRRSLRLSNLPQTTGRKQEDGI